MPSAAPFPTVLPSSSRTPSLAIQVAILLAALAILGCEIYRFINDSRRSVQSSPEQIAINDLKIRIDALTIQVEIQNKNITENLSVLLKENNNSLNNIKNEFNNLFIQIVNSSNKDFSNKKAADQTNGNKEPNSQTASNVKKNPPGKSPENEGKLKSADSPKQPGPQGTTTKPDDGEIPTFRGNKPPRPSAGAK